jgi:uncharacterized membrane protein YeiB
MTTGSNRISGYDFARGLAIIGMIYVNFKVVMVPDGQNGFMYHIVEMLSGKAAALFVVLAGVGMTLMYQGAVRKNSRDMIKYVKISLIKRAIFLFLVGFSYYFLWPADILHYYGIYLVIGVLFLSVSRVWLQIISIVIIVGYTASCFVFDYEAGWDWEKMEYINFFTLQGFLKNLFFNGFHPVFPWITFLLTGIWVGRIDFKQKKIRSRVLIISLLIFVVTKVISFVLVSFFTALSPAESEEIYFVFGTSPMPPLFFYMISGSSLAVFLITISIMITEKYPGMLFVKQIIYTGQLALSNYFAHVVVGMLMIWVVFGELEKAFSIEFVVAYATIFSIITVVFSHYWRSKYKRGPLEFLMRKITG